MVAWPKTVNFHLRGVISSFWAMLHDDVLLRKKERVKAEISRCLCVSRALEVASMY